MRADDRRYATSVLNSFVEASVARYAETGMLQYTYKVTGSGIKEETGRKRFKAETIQAYLQYFKETCTSVEYQPTSEMFVVTIDLGTMALTGKQARLFAEVKTKKGKA